VRARERGSWRFFACARCFAPSVLLARFETKKAVWTVPDGFQPISASQDRSGSPIYLNLDQSPTGFPSRFTGDLEGFSMIGTWKGIGRRERSTAFPTSRGRGRGRGRFPPGHAFPATKRTERCMRAPSMEGFPTLGAPGILRFRHCTSHSSTPGMTSSASSSGSVNIRSSMRPLTVVVVSGLRSR